jgi:hypothetical protein
LIQAGGGVLNDDTLGEQEPDRNVPMVKPRHGGPRGPMKVDPRTICKEPAAVLRELFSSSEEEIELSVSDEGEN